MNPRRADSGVFEGRPRGPRIDLRLARGTPLMLPIVCLVVDVTFQARELALSRT